MAVAGIYLDAELTRTFDGHLLPGEGRAVSSQGQEVPTLYGPAVESGAPLTKLAFEKGLGKAGGYIVLFSVLLFAISTAISWSYYGDRCANYLLGTKAILPFKMVFVLMHFTGAVLNLATVWALGDIALGFVTFPNLIALVMLSGVTVQLTKSYFERKPWIQNAKDHKKWVAEHKK